jgi:hypothetical protein
LRKGGNRCDQREWMSRGLGRSARKDIRRNARDYAPFGAGLRQFRICEFRSAVARFSFDGCAAGLAAAVTVCDAAGHRADIIIRVSGEGDGREGCAEQNGYCADEGAHPPQSFLQPVCHGARYSITIRLSCHKKNVSPAFTSQNSSP